MTSDELINKEFCRLIPKKTLSYDEIIYTVSLHTGINATVMLKHIRCSSVVRSRDLFFYCAFQFHQNLSEIGRYIGFNHATILHSIKKVINTNRGEYFKTDMQIIMKKLVELNNLKLKVYE